MARKSNKLPSFTNVSAGSTAVLNLPLGLSYDRVDLNFAGVTLAQMRNIRLEVNGKVLQKWKDGERLNALNKYFGRGAATSSILPINFVRKEMHDLMQRRVFAIGTQNISTLSLLIDIDRAATNPTLKATAIKSNAAPIGLVTRLKTFPVSFSTAGTHDVDNLPIEPHQRIAAIHLFSSDVTECELEIDNEIVWDMTKVQAQKIQVDHSRAVQSNALSLDFILEGDLAQAVTGLGIQDFRLKPTTSGPTTIDIVVEYFEPYGG